MTHRVAVLALDGVMPFDLGIPARVLNEAVDAAGHRLYEVVTCSLGGAPVRTNTDVSIVVRHDESVLAGADTVVVATQEPTRHLLATGEVDPRVRAALALVHPDARVVSLCTSAFVLAAAGLLDGLPATTHWSLADVLAERFPRVEVRPGVLFVDTGRVLTAAGAAAGIDLFLHLVRLDHGAAVANAAARRCVVAPWRDGGQAQFIEQPTPPDGAAASTGPTRAWALAHLDRPLTLEDLAAHATMSVRTFTRRFRAEVGLSPTQWVIAQRVDRARSLLETSDLPVEQVAARSGFGSAALLRQHLAAALGVPPQAYRRTFRAPAAP